jgi:hypothetical protein
MKLRPKNPRSSQCGHVAVYQYLTPLPFPDLPRILSFNMPANTWGSPARPLAVCSVCLAPTISPWMPPKYTSSEATTLIALCGLHRNPLTQSFVHPVTHNLPANEADSNHNHPARRRSKKPHHISQGLRQAILGHHAINRVQEAGVFFLLEERLLSKEFDKVRC